ncbi:MAG: calcium-binding protein [Gemmatimonadetes bacterium]|nr:calcium-binding protein [Gemmatimonadota bacterium]
MGPSAGISYRAGFAALAIAFTTSTPPGRLTPVGERQPQAGCPRLLAPQGEALGQVCVGRSGDSLIVEYRAAEGWSLLETHLAVATSLDRLPIAESGIPRIGMFPVAGVHPAGTRVARHAVALSAIGSPEPGSELVIAAHASVQSPTGGEEGLWAEGRRFVDQGMRATYFTWRFAPAGLASGFAARKAGHGAALTPELEAPAAGLDTDRQPPAEAPFATARAPALRMAMTSWLEAWSHRVQRNPRLDNRSLFSAVDTLRGGPGRDVLVGTDQASLIEGLGGPDWLIGGPSGDALKGGEGDDILEGLAGSDILEGGVGNDVLKGGPGNDWLFGEDGDDLIHADSGADVVDGGAGADQLHGEDGDDLIDGNADNDFITGGPGNDTLDGGDGEDHVRGGDGDDDIDGGDENDQLFGDDGDDTIAGHDGDDLLDGGAGDDVLNGGDGDDTIRGGDGNDVLLGEEGNDLLDGGGGDDVIGGSDGDDVLVGGAGNDTLNGQQGNDWLRGGADADVLNGGAGNDVLEGGPGDDLLMGGHGNDVLYAGVGDDEITLRAGDVMADGMERIEGGSGDNTLVLYGFDEGAIVVLDTSRVAPARPDTAGEAADTVPQAIPPLRMTLRLTDPLTGGTYHVSGITRIVHRALAPVTPPLASGTADVLLVNGSLSEPATFAIDWFRPTGALDTSSVPDQRAGAMADTLLPAAGLRLIRQSSDSIASLEVRTNHAVAIVAPVALPGLGGGSMAAATPGEAVIVPVRIDQEAGHETGFVIASASRQTPVKLTLINDAGVEVEARNVVLNARGRLHGPFHQFFPEIRRFSGKLLIEGEHITAAALLSDDAKRIMVSPGFRFVGTVAEITSSFPPADEAHHFTVPAASSGSAVLRVQNLRGENGPPGVSRGTVRFLDSGGSPLELSIEGHGDVSEIPFELANSATLLLTVPVDANAGDFAVRVEPGEGAVDALLDHWPAQHAPFATRGVSVFDRFLAPVRRSARGELETLLSLQSTSAAARYRLTLRDENGAAIRTTRVDVPAGGMVIRSLAALFPALRDRDFLGSVTGIAERGQALVGAVQLGQAPGSSVQLPVLRLTSQ